MSPESNRASTTPRYGAEVAPGTEYHCHWCGHRANASTLPQACPLCGSSSWTHAASEATPFTVKRLGISKVLITPPAVLDIPTSMRLSETIVQLALDQTEIVVDLTSVDVVDSSTALLLSRLGRLAHGSGGRLLAVCATRAPGEIELFELDVDDRGIAARVSGSFGRALRSVVRARTAAERA